MGEREKIEDIVNIMSGQVDMSDFFNEIVSNINKVTQEKFLNGIKETVNMYKEKSMQESMKEINLLNAMKAFMPENSRGEIDKFTNMMGEIKAITGILNDVQQTQIKSQEKKKEAVKEDLDTLIIEGNTVYEIDKDCQGRVNSTSAIGSHNILPLLLMFMLMGIK
ncbi:hypothetical protein EDC18_10344 [Natranaerovirga pectinivora]|uniref:Uncharacterized protein n=1 Tax=Natranaerovirga pectinivora TaxID=682400 RepID=A0A4V2V0C2_9FIRM|nr:hypothetical protein [Natranaerovirga pectinivora]TCT15340.1 hypothetical protein EDC18_10344 [Natranaerovirga pectinivora]